jgi:Fe-S cluster assembly ATPase SufC
MLRIVLEEKTGFSEERRDVLLRKLHLEGFRGRDLNLGFSGGEIKRSVRRGDQALGAGTAPCAGP